MPGEKGWDEEGLRNFVYALTLQKFPFLRRPRVDPAYRGARAGGNCTWSRHLRTLSPVVSATGGPVGIVQPPAPLRHPFGTL